MSVGRYFQDELDYLRRSGAEFSRAHPHLTDYLSEQSNDPDVERLLEGFAFLTGKLREKIDDQLPEVTQSLLALLWPNFLRPVPAITIMELSPKPGAISEKQTVAEHTEVLSVPVDDTVCQFRTCYSTDVYPLRMASVEHSISKDASVVALRLETLSEEPVTKIGLQYLRLHAGGSAYSSAMMNFWINRYLDKVEFRPKGTEIGISLNPDQVVQGGLSPEEAVLPYPNNAFVGYRLLQEFFACPEKYFFNEFRNLPLSTLPPDATGFELILHFQRPLPPDVRVEPALFRLHCVPAINLFQHDAEPLLLDGRHSEYKVTPEKRDASEIEVFSIEAVRGWAPAPDARSGGIERDYARFESFHHEIERANGREAIYFHEQVKQSISGEALERSLSFVHEDLNLIQHGGETISIDLLCSNATAPAHLAIGDICVPTRSVPAFVDIKNITRPSVPCNPVVDGTMQWQLISALSLNYLSLQDTEALRVILSTFDFPARVDRQRERGAKRRLDGIEEIRSDTVDRLFRGLPVRGVRTTINMRESAFSNEGEMFLFATVLAEFFALYATVNSFHELIVKGLDHGEEYRWRPRIGNQPLV